MNKLLALFALLLTLLAGPLAAQELRIATLAPDGSSWMNELREAERRIAAATEQRVRIRYYPGGVMGDASAVLRRMRLNQVQGGAFTVGDLAALTPAVNLYSLPFLFESEADVQAIRAEFDPLIMAALADAGMIIPGLSLGGFAYLFGRESFPSPEQLSTSWRVWVPAGDELSRRTLEAAGVSPVPLPLADVYTSLQTGAINTFASTPSAAIILQWHTRARHMLDLPILMTAGTIGIDNRALQRLAEADREIVLKEFAQALERLERANHRDNESARQALMEQGIRISAPSAEHAETWRRIARQTRERMIASGQIEVPNLDRMIDVLNRLHEAE